MFYTPLRITVNQSSNNQRPRRTVTFDYSIFIFQLRLEETTVANRHVRASEQLRSIVSTLRSGYLGKFSNTTCALERCAEVELFRLLPRAIIATERYLSQQGLGYPLVSWHDGKKEAELGSFNKFLSLLLKQLFMFDSTYIGLYRWTKTYMYKTFEQICSHFEILTSIWQFQKQVSLFSEWTVGQLECTFWAAFANHQ